VAPRSDPLPVEQYLITMYNAVRDPGYFNRINSIAVSNEPLRTEAIKRAEAYLNFWRSAMGGG
jgi:hypothetical protein